MPLYVYTSFFTVIFKPITINYKLGLTTTFTLVKGQYLAWFCQTRKETLINEHSEQYSTVKPSWWSAESSGEQQNDPN